MFENSIFDHVKLGDVIAKKETRDPRRRPSDIFQYVDISSVSNSQFAVVEPKSILGKDAPSRARKVIRYRDIIFATTRPYLKSIAVVPESLDNEICSTGFCVLRPTEVIASEWLFYCASSDQFVNQITPLMRGANYPAVTDKDILGIHIPLPQLNEQHRIIANIKECMERVEEIEALRGNVRYDSEFLPSAVFADYIESLDPFKIGDTVIGDIVIDCKYGSSIKANNAAKGFPVLRMGNIQGGRIDTTDLKYIEMPKKEQIKYDLQEGDILINRTNSLELVGKSAVFKGLSGNWIYASYLIRIRVNKNKALPEYVNAVINSRIGRGYVYRTARRAIGMVNINAKEIQRMPLPLPSIAVQAELIEKMNEVEPLVDELTAHFQEDGIAHLRESILRKAFAGEL